MNNKGNSDFHVYKLNWIEELQNERNFNKIQIPPKYILGTSINSAQNDFITTKQPTF